jgi:hypothetical protein
MNYSYPIFSISPTNRHKNCSIDPNYDKIALSKSDRTPMMLSALLKKSIVWIFSIALCLTFVISASANAPQPPSLYWLKFDSPAKLQSVQIAQCQDKDCQKSIVIKQYGTCTQADCMRTSPKLTQSKPLHLDCADNLCLVALSPFYDKKELNPDRLYLIAQLDNRVSLSKIFPLIGRNDRGDKFTVKAIANTLEISPSAAEKVSESPIFQNLFLFYLGLTVGIESIIWAGYLRWKQVAFKEIEATILSVLLVHAFSFAIVWFSFPGLQHFAPQSTRYGGLAWLGFSILYGIILSLYIKLAKKSLSSVVTAGSSFYWLGAAFVSVVIAALFSYGSPLPFADGLSQPIAILASEIFVVGYEAWIIQRLRRDILNFKTALLVSLVANTASCLIGLTVNLFVLR